MFSPPDKIGTLRFSTDDLPLCDRAPAIRALRERGIVPLEPLADRAVHVRITKWFLPGAGILAGMLGGLRQVAGAQTEEASDDLLFGINLAGGSTARQGRREIALEGGGDAVLLSSAAGSFTITRPVPVRFLGLRVPRKAVAPLVTGLDDLTMRRLPGKTAALTLLTRYVRVLADSRMLGSPEIDRLAASHLHDLIALSIGAPRMASMGPDGHGIRAARLRVIKSDIGMNLGDDALTLSALAARHGVTTRYIHKLFETEGITYTQFVLGQRLDRAYRMLRNSRFAAQQISAIAYEVGFGDLSYFNRAFRRHYGATPSDIRKRGLAD